MFRTPKAAAELVAVSTNQLKRMRIEDRRRAAAGQQPEGPPWREHQSPGGRTQVAYPEAELKEWALSFWHMSGVSPPVRRAA